jgi:hypothetical protein
MSLLGFSINDEKFYELAQEGVSIKVDVPKRTVTVAGIPFLPFFLFFLLTDMKKYQILISDLFGLIYTKKRIFLV